MSRLVATGRGDGGVRPGSYSGNPGVTRKCHFQSPCIMALDWGPFVKCQFFKYIFF